MIERIENKLCLGTAQFGLDYGISNKSGRVGQCEVEKILCHARDVGVLTLDTASQYGNADRVLGEVIAEQALDFYLMAKSPSLRGIDESLDSFRSIISEHLDKSLTTLNADTFDVFYIRNLDHFLEIHEAKAVDFLYGLRESGKVQKVGISVYSRAQIDAVLKYFTPDAIQIPFSILDQRLKRDGTLSMLARKNVEIHVRSIFTQGLIFLPLDDLPPYFFPYKKEIEIVRENIKKANMKPLQAALHFVLDQAEISKIIFGVSTFEEFQEILEVVNRDLPSNIDWAEYALYNDAVLNPQNWK